MTEVFQVNDKDYSQELLTLYISNLEEYGLSSNGRKDYIALVKIMKKIIKDIPESKKEVLGMAKRLKEKFSINPRRPAMIEELDKILD